MDNYRNNIYNLDVVEYLSQLPDECIDCVVTSPPYYALRWYGDYDQQIGLEETPEQYIKRLVEVFRQIRRVLKPSGVVWLNMGDSYWTGKGQSGMQDEKVQRHRKACGKTFSKEHSNIAGKGKTAPKDRHHPTFKAKDLMMMPHRLAIALCDDGWWVRNDVVWAKTNANPEGVKDRFTRSHEYVFQLAKSKRYWFDVDAVRQQASAASLKRINQSTFDSQQGGPKDYGKSGINPSRSGRKSLENFAENPGSNMRSVLNIATEPNTWSFGDTQHFAAFAQALIEPLIEAACPRKVCAHCGKPYRPKNKKMFVPQADVSAARVAHRGKVAEQVDGHRKYEGTPRGSNIVTGSELIKACSCDSDETLPGLVLDPFMGTGTVAAVARRLCRDFAGTELNSDYHKMAIYRLNQTDPFHSRMVGNNLQLSLFSEVE